MPLAVLRAGARNWIRANCNLILILWAIVSGLTSALAMAFTRIVCLFFVCLLGSGSATFCTSGNDCSWSESCCKEGVCRETCSVHCSYDYQCGNSEQCCDGICSSWCANSSPSPTPRTGWKQSQVIGLIIFVLFSASITTCICCCCCACCPYHRHRSSRT